MNGFWKWLMKTNARLVFMCALVALIGAGAYWGWQLTHPIDVKPFMAAGTKKKSKTDLGLLGFVNRQLSPDLYALPGNSFLTPGTPERMYVKTERPPPPAERPPKEIVKPPPPPPPPVKPPPPPPPPPVKLTYKGIMKREGMQKAWIMDSESKKSSFYDVGEKIFGATLDSMTMTEAHITLPNGTSLELKFGKEQAIID